MPPETSETPIQTVREAHERAFGVQSLAASTDTLDAARDRLLEMLKSSSAETAMDAADRLIGLEATRAMIRRKWSKP